MMLRRISISILTGVSLFACSVKHDPERKSRVENFKYGGFGDTIYALIDGSIYETDLLHHFSDSIPAGDLSSGYPKAFIVCS